MSETLQNFMYNTHYAQDIINMYVETCVRDIRKNYVMFQIRSNVQIALLRRVHLPCNSRYNIRTVARVHRTSLPYKGHFHFCDGNNNRVLFST